MSAGCMGWPRKLALLLMKPPGAMTALKNSGCRFAQLLLNLLCAIEMPLDDRPGFFDQGLQFLILRRSRLLRQVEYGLVDPDLLVDVGRSNWAPLGAAFNAVISAS